MHWIESYFTYGYSRLLPHENSCELPDGTLLLVDRLSLWKTFRSGYLKLYGTRGLNLLVKVPPANQKKEISRCDLETIAWLSKLTSLGHVDDRFMHLSM